MNNHEPIQMWPAKPTPAEYTVICDHYQHFPVEDGWFKKSDAPSLVRTAGGALLCSVPQVFVDGPQDKVRPLWFYRSTDDGVSWEKLAAESDFSSGTLFEWDGSLYYLGVGPCPKKARCQGIRIIRSDDHGMSWSEPVDLFKGVYYLTSAGYVIRNGHLYWCCCDGGWKTTYVLAGDLNADPMNPAAWRISDGQFDPGVPASLTVGKGNSRILEGNVVEVEGRLRVIWRYQYDLRSTSGIAAVYDLDDEGGQLDYRFRQFYPWPGATIHFYVLRDPRTGLYWMTANLPTHTQSEALGKVAGADERFMGGLGNERRILGLFVSFDALNWLPTGYVAIWPLMRQASNYCGLLIDGDDLLVASRSSRNGRHQHDNDLTTFHRVPRFRALAEPFYSDYVQPQS